MTSNPVVVVEEANVEKLVETNQLLTNINNLLEPSTISTDNFQHPKRLDAITDALIYQSQFGGIYCNSFIPANCTVTTIITFWFTKEVEVILWHFEAGKAEITA